MTRTTAGCAAGADYTRTAIDAGSWATDTLQNTIFEQQDKRLLRQADENIPAARARLRERQAEAMATIERERQAEAYAAARAAQSSYDAQSASGDSGSFFSTLLGAAAAVAPSIMTAGIPSQNDNSMQSLTPGRMPLTAPLCRNPDNSLSNCSFINYGNPDTREVHD